MVSNHNNELPEGFKMTELGPLPEEWEVVKIEQLGHVTAGGSAPQGDRYFGGKNPFVRVQHLEQGIDKVIGWDIITDEAVREYGLRLFPKGTIIFPKSGASIRLEKRAVLQLDAYIVSHLCAVLPNTHMVDGDFLYNVLKAIRFSENKAEGYPTLGLSEIKSTLILRPPLPEQRAIARVLSTIRRAIEAQNKLIAAARQLKKSLMRHLFTYGPVPVSEADKVLLKETEIGPVPEHWAVTDLGLLVDIQYGVQAAVANLKDPTKGIPILTNVNITNEGKLDLSLLRYYELKPNQHDKLLLQKGDVLFNWRSGSSSHVGKAALFDVAGEYTYSSFILRFRPKTKIKNAYLYHFLTHLKALCFFAEKRSQSSINSVFNASLSSKIPIAVAPLSDQPEIVDMLSAIDHKISTEENHKASLQSLFKTMLHLLMTGQLRVKDLEV